MKRQNRLHFYGLVFLLVGLVVPGLSGTALGAQKKDVKKAVEADVNMNNKKVTKSKTIRKGPDEMRLPGEPRVVLVELGIGHRRELAAPFRILLGQVPLKQA